MDTNGKRKKNELFDTTHLKAGLKGHAVRGGMITLTSQGAKFALNMVSTIVLARILVPADYGLVAMVTTLVNFASLFKDLGLSMAVVQNKEVTHEQVSTLFWINFALSVLLTLLFCAIAPLISLFYHEPRLIMITLALSCTFVFSGLIIQHQALLRRQMKFMTLGLIDIGSRTVGVVSAIVLALMGAKYWALVALTCFSVIANSALIWCFCRWLPGLPRRGTGVRSMLKFGGHLTGFNIINYFTRNLDNILLGRFWGANVLGLYSKAYSIMMLPIAQIRVPLQTVALPALSCVQDDPEQYRRYYLKLIKMVAFLSMPLMVFLFVSAKEVILLFLGPNWSGAVNIFKVLCIVAFLQPVSSTRGLVLVSLGHSKKYLIWGMFNGITTVLSFLIGIKWSAMGVSISYTAANYLTFLPSLWYVVKDTPIKMRDFFISISGPCVASLVMGTILMLAHNYFYELTLYFLFLIGVIVYLGSWITVPRGRAYLRELARFRQLILKTS